MKSIIIYVLAYIVGSILSGAIIFSIAIVVEEIKEKISKAKNKVQKDKGQIKGELMKMTKFELDLLKVVSNNGDGDECFEDVDVLIDMRMKGYYKGIDDGITVDELIWRYENVD